jgi:putative endonuclease
LSRAEAERSGRRAETIAAWWMRLQGWRILARRVRTPAGEVDLVARRHRTVAFIEVKTRRTDESLAIAVDRHRLIRVARSAEALIPRFARRGETTRIDVILVAPGRLPHHLKNVWHG